MIYSALHFKTKKEKIMNKGELVNEVAKVLKTKKDAQAAVDCVFSSIMTALENGDSVSLIGFGTFKVAERNARQGRNPQTGEEMYIPASKVPKFSAGKALKDAVK
jgi:DNA-binding protein HU-beta